MYKVELQPFLFWRLGEKVTSPEPSFKDGVASLAIARCTHQNAGVYTCVAENSAGRRTSSAVLRFTGEDWHLLQHDLQLTEHWTDCVHFKPCAPFAYIEGATKEVSRTNNHDLQKEVTLKHVSSEKTQLSLPSEEEKRHEEGTLRTIRKLPLTTKLLKSSLEHVSIQKIVEKCLAKANSIAQRDKIQNTP